MTSSVDGIAFHALRSSIKPAVCEFASGVRLSYAELDELTARLARALANRSGERIAWLGRNSLALLATHLACARVGAIFVPLNWRLSALELSDIVADAKPSVLVHDASFEDVAKAITESEFLRRRTDDWLCEAHASRPLRARALPAQAPSLILYTSGTTGRPKGVVHTEQSLFFSAFNMALGAAMGPDTVFLCDAPMFHVIGLVAAAKTTLLFGGEFLISDAFDSETTLKRLSDPVLGVTHYFCVPAMADAIMRHPSFAHADLTRLKALGTGGAPHPPASIRRWLERGVPIADGFGMSEAGSVMLMPSDNPDLSDAKAGSCGPALPATEIRLVDVDGKDVPSGHPGEIWMRGPNLALGYWNRPNETAAAFGGGWFRTGDVACADDNHFYYIVDRKTDMFISGGENVYPAEIEAVLAEVEGIEEVAVVGVPDEKWGEVGCAFLVPIDGNHSAERDARARCEQRLAGFKRPARYVELKRLPRTATGKLDKTQIRAMARERTDTAIRH